jgi:hypothetical protein
LNRLPLLGALSFLGFAASLSTLPAQVAPDGLAAVLREVVVNSLHGGGTRADALLVAGDSASAALLRFAGVPAQATPGSEALLCPSSTDADGRPAPPPVGYVLRATLTVDIDSSTAQLRVTKRCRFRYRGGGRGFGEGADWELRRETGRWRVIGTSNQWIT